MIFKLKDPGSAVTHFIGALLAAAVSVPLMATAVRFLDRRGVAGVAVFAGGLIALYAASTIYHSLNVSERVNGLLRRLDHMMIFVLIAASYTPVCLVSLRGGAGFLYMCVVWAFAAAGMIFKACWISCPDWLSSSIYIIMGWICAFNAEELARSMPAGAFICLVIGGAVYTAGGVIYAFEEKLKGLGFKYFGVHEVFHLFVMAGSLFHVITMFIIAKNSEFLTVP